jgi:hypothetical protein
LPKGARIRVQRWFVLALPLLTSCAAARPSTPASKPRVWWGAPIHPATLAACTVPPVSAEPVVRVSIPHSDGLTATLPQSIRSEQTHFTRRGREVTRWGTRSSNVTFEFQAVRIGQLRGADVLMIWPDARGPFENTRASCTHCMATTERCAMAIGGEQTVVAIGEDDWGPTAYGAWEPAPGLWYIVTVSAREAGDHAALFRMLGSIRSGG